MESVLFALLGWLFGLLSPGIAERIRRSYRSSEVQKAIATELGELRYTLAWSGYLLCHRTGLLTDAALDWIIPAVRSYTGPLANSTSADILKNLRSKSERERASLLSPVNEDQSLSLKVLSLPLLSAHLSEMALFPVGFQAAVLRIMGQLDIYNQHVTYLQGQFNLTFTVTDATNIAALKANQLAGVRFLARMAETISDLILRTVHVD